MSNNQNFIITCTDRTGLILGYYVNMKDNCDVVINENIGKAKIISSIQELKEEFEAVKTIETLRDAETGETFPVMWVYGILKMDVDYNDYDLMDYMIQ